MKGEKIFIAHDKTMCKKIYDFASEESASRFFFYGIGNFSVCRGTPTKTL